MALNRRTSIISGLGLLTTAMIQDALAAKGFFADRGLPLGLQLYVLGDAPKADLEGTLKRVAKIGYRTVELPGHRLGSAATVRAAADNAGLSLACVHLAAQSIGENMSLTLEPAEIANELRALGVSDVVVPFPLFPAYKPEPGENAAQGWLRALASAGTDHWKRTAGFLNAKGEALRREGLNLGYHNHNFEFAPVAGTSTGWDILVAETDPRLVSFEVDIGWVAAAGIEPVSFLTRHAGRLRQMHIKDIQPSTKPNFKGSMDTTEVGSGSLDWKSILPAAYRAGVRQFYVEQEPPYKMDRFESAAKSYAYLTGEV
jgi:sugar phosphate isomerase/epimerase